MSAFLHNEQSSAPVRLDDDEGDINLSDPYGVGVANVTRSSEPMLVDPDQIWPLVGQLLPLIQAHFVTASLNVAGRLRIADILGKETLSVSEIAERINTATPVDEKRLGRILRFLAGHGVLSEGQRSQPTSTAAADDGEEAAIVDATTYSLTPLAALLQTDLPHQPSLLPGLLHFVEQANWESIINLPGAVTNQLTEETPFHQANNGQDIWEFYNNNPSNLQNFAAFMTTISAPETAIVENSIDWSDFAGKTVADIGGSEGVIMSAVKAAEPSVRAISFDLPDVVSRVPGIDGVEFVGGDMFSAETLPRADVYIMKHILHDWSDQRCREILENIHAASGPDATLILAEGIVVEPGSDDPLKMTVMTIDIMMMTVGGTERSRAEWQSLLSSVGWRIEKITPTDGPLCQLITCKKA